MQYQSLLSHKIQMHYIALIWLLLFEATREDNAVEKTSDSAPFLFGQLENNFGQLENDFGQLENNQIQEISSINDVQKKVEKYSVDDSQKSGSSFNTWPRNFLTWTFKSSSLLQVTKCSWKSK